MILIDLKYGIIQSLNLDTSPSLHPDTWYFQILAPPSLHKLVFLSRRTFEYLSLSLLPSANFQEAETIFFASRETKQRHIVISNFR